MELNIAMISIRLSKIDIIISFLILVYTAFFTFLTFSMYESFYYYDFDLAIFNQIMWNSLHDGLFNSTIITGGNYLSQQMTPILILFLPFCALFQTPKLLLFLQTLFLAFGAVPLYLIVKSRLNDRWGLFFSFLYLIHPTVASMNLFEFHTNTFEIFFLLFSFYFLMKRKMIFFLLFSFLSMLCKEDVAPVIIAFGVYAFFLRYERRYVLGPIFIGAAYFMAVFLLIMPAFGGGQYIYFASEQYGRYSHLGRSTGEILSNLFSHPQYFIGLVFTQHKIEYLAQMFAFSGFLPLFSCDILIMTITPLAENLLSAAGTQTSIAYQYSSSLTPFLIVASAISVERLFRWTSGRQMYKRICLTFIFFSLAVSIVSSIFYNPVFTFVSNRSILIPDEKDIERKVMLECIPEDASVMATFNFLPKLSNRKQLYSYHYWYLYGKLNLSGVSLEDETVEYILIDLNDFYMSNVFISPEGNMRQKELLKDPTWGIVSLSDDMVLLKRGFKSPYTIIDVYEMLMKDEVGQANFTAALWLKENTNKEDIFYATTVSSHVQYVSEISERQFLNYTSDPTISKELSSIERPENFGKDVFIQTLKKYNVSYVYIYHKFGKSEVVIWGTTKRTIFSKPDIIASHLEIFELVYENDFVRIYRVIYPKFFKQ